MLYIGPYADIIIIVYQIGWLHNDCTVIIIIHVHMILCKNGMCNQGVIWDHTFQPVCQIGLHNIYYNNTCDAIQVWNVRPCCRHAFQLA